MFTTISLDLARKFRFFPNTKRISDRITSLPQIYQKKLEYHYFNLGSNPNTNMTLVHTCFEVSFFLHFIFIDLELF